MSGHADEETPLLAGKKQATPLPWFQFTIVLFLQITEPLTSHVIYPFAPQLIRDIGITHGDESKVGYYVGLMQSLFYVTEAFTVLHWSRLSDHIGRKPVILLGLLGLSILMFCFGLSTTFWGLVLSRSLHGALSNERWGSKKTFIAGISTAIPAFIMFPVVNALARTQGYSLGGNCITTYFFDCIWSIFR